MVPLCQHLAYDRKFFRPFAEFGFLSALVFFCTVAITIAVSITVSVTIAVTVTIAVSGLLLLG